MCARTFFWGGGREFIDHLRNWYLCKNCPISRSWIKERLITLPVFVFQILMFVKKEVRSITSCYHLVRPQHRLHPVPPVQLLFPHGKAQAFSALTSFFCSPVLIWLLRCYCDMFGSLTLVTPFSSFTKWLPKSLSRVLILLNLYVQWHFLRMYFLTALTYWLLRCESPGVLCRLEWSVATDLLASLANKMEVERSSETMVNVYLSTLCNIPEDLNSYQHRSVVTSELHFHVSSTFRRNVLN